MNKKHALLNFVIFFIFWGIIIFIALPAWALLEGDTDLDAKTIVDRVVAEYTQRHCLLYDSETIVTWPGREFKEGDRIKLRYVCRFIQDKDRIDWSNELFETVDEKEELFKITREIWDGSMFLFRTKLPNDMDMPNAYFTIDESTVNTLMRVDNKDSFLDGILGQIGSGHYTQDLLDSEQMTLHKQMEKINGHACYVIEAILRKGIIGKFWIDPAAGYNLRKVVVNHELVGDTSKPPPGVIVIKNTATFEYVIDNVVLEQIGGRWFPVAGICDFKKTYTDGNLHHSKREVRRTNIVWNPNLEALRAFKMDLPEGTKLSCLDDDNDYVWRGGKPEKITEIQIAMVGQHASPLLSKNWYNSPSDGIEFNGKVVLLDFFGIWCRPCMAKIPFIKELHKLYSSRGLVVIGVHTEVAQEKIPAFISDEEINYIIAVDSNGLNAKSYNIFSYPATVLIDSEGIIRAINPDEIELKNLLKAYLK